MSELQEITVSGILEDLNNGLDRKAIGEKYSLKLAEVKIMFDHPKLKGKKAKKKVELSFKLVDDTEVVETIGSIEDTVDHTAPVDNVDPAFEAEPEPLTKEDKEEVAGEVFGTMATEAPSFE